MKDFFRKSSTVFQFFKEKRLIKGNPDQPTEAEPPQAEKPDKTPGPLDADSAARNTEQRAAPLFQDRLGAKKGKGLRGLGLPGKGLGLRGKSGRLLPLDESKLPPAARKALREGRARQEAAARAKREAEARAKREEARQHPEPPPETSAAEETVEPAEEAPLTKAEQQKMQQRVDAREQKEGSEALSQEAQERMKEIQEQIPKIQSMLEGFPKLIEQKNARGEFFSDEAIDLINTASKTFVSANPDINRANRTLNKALNLLSQAENAFNNDNFKQAKKLYQKAGKILEQCKTICTKIESTYEKSINLVDDAKKALEKPPAELLPELVDKLGVTVKIKRKVTKVKGGGGEFAIGGETVSYTTNIKMQPGLMSQNDFNEAIKPLNSYDQELHAVQLSPAQLGKIYGTYAALQVLGLTYEAKTFKKNVFKALDPVANKIVEGEQPTKQDVNRSKQAIALVLNSPMEKEVSGLIALVGEEEE